MLGVAGDNRGHAKTHPQGQHLPVLWCLAWGPLTLLRFQI